MRRTFTARPRAAVALAVALAAVMPALAGCAAQPPSTPPAVTRPPDVAVEKGAPPPPVVPVRWPLTGVATTEVANRPALAVKIENPRLVRPQTGLDAADVVWEQVVEGGITRFVAVFHSTIPGEVGPIRSVRPMDPDIAAPLGGLMAFSGGQPRFVAALREAGLQVLSHDAGDDGFYRRSIRAAPHNVFGDPAAFLAQADAAHSAPPPEGFRIAPRPDLTTAVRVGSPATAVALVLSDLAQPSWAWDATSGTWLRSEAGVPATAASGTRLAAANVVALRVDLVDSGTRDPSGAVVPDTQVVGTGTGVVATGGRVLDVVWSKESVAAPLALTTPDGQPVLLGAGVTWVELVPNGSGSITVA